MVSVDVKHHVYLLAVNRFCSHRNNNNEIPKGKIFCLLKKLGLLLCSRLTWVSHSSLKSSATHSYQCVQYFRVSKQWHGFQSLRFLTCE